MAVSLARQRCEFMSRSHVHPKPLAPFCLVPSSLLKSAADFSLCSLFLADAAATAAIFSKIIIAFAEPLFPPGRLPGLPFLNPTPSSLLLTPHLPLLLPFLPTAILSCKIIEHQPAIICSPNRADAGWRLLKPHLPAPTSSFFSPSCPFSYRSVAACLCRPESWLDDGCLVMSPRDAAESRLGFH